MAKKDISIRLSLKDGEAVRRGLMLLGDEGRKALAKIERQSKPASKGLLAVNAVAGELRGGMSAMAGRLGAVGAGLGAIGPAGLIAAAGIGATVAALVGLTRASVNAANELAAIKDEAQQAGAAVETYQALRYAAEEYSVSQDALTDGLKELNLRADEFVTTGGGSAAEAFRRIGLGQDELRDKLGDTGELFLDVVRRMRGLESDAARIRVADEIFGGTGGEQFVRLVAAGEEAIRNLMREARDLGYVMDESLIERADETRDKMNQLQRLIDLQLNSALVDLAPIALGVAEAFAQVAKWVADVVDGFRDLENQSTRGLERRLEELDEYFANNSRPRGGRARRGYDNRLEERERLRKLLKGRQSQEIQSRNRRAIATETSDARKEAERIRKVTAALRFQLDQLTRTEYGKQVWQELQRAGIDGNHREAQTIARLVFAVRDQEAAAKEKAKAEKDGETMTKAVMTAEEKRQEAIREINRLLTAGAITEETAARAREEAARTFEEAERKKLAASREAADGIKRALADYADNAANMAKSMEGVTTSALQGMEDAFVKMATTGKLSFRDMSNSIIADIARILVRRQITGPLANMLGGALSGVFGGAAGGLFQVAHGGGMVGNPVAVRRANPMAFVDAPRFHGGGTVPGLRPGETPIVALRGERILTEAQQADTARTIAGLAALAKPAAPSVNVVVNNNAGAGTQARAQVSQGRDGGLDVEIIVEEIENRMTRNVARGEGMAPMLETRYGLNPAAGARR